MRRTGRALSAGPERRRWGDSKGGKVFLPPFDLVGVAVVNVGEVGMSMHQRGVLVGVLVASAEIVGVYVAVVAIVMVVGVVVDHGVVAMLVCVIAPQHRGDARQRDSGRDHRPRRHVVAKNRPGDDDPDKRCGGEHELAASGAELTGAGNPHGDRNAIAERPDDERT